MESYLFSATHSGTLTTKTLYVQWHCESLGPRILFCSVSEIFTNCRQVSDTLVKGVARLSSRNDIMSLSVRLKRRIRATLSTRESLFLFDPRPGQRASTAVDLSSNSDI